jgi:16S rRNA (uracil1498-N3)-methyltransferase
MEYFYAPPEAVRGDQCVIAEEEFAHLTHVMRRKVGDPLRIADGTGMAYDAVITGIEGRRALCRIEARHPLLNEPRVRVTLGAGLLKNPSRFDMLVEKGTELGVVRFVPLLTERTIPRHARTDRWRKIALSAMKQAGRCVLPEVAEPVSLAEYLRSLPSGGLGIIPHEQTEGPALRGPIPGAEVRICIGPEGGFTDLEVAGAVSAGFRPVSLGRRRLRTETAALLAAGLLLLDA